MPRPHEQRVAALRLAIVRSGQEPGYEHTCPYLPGRHCRELAFRVEDLEPGVYHALMDLNFRRSGSIVYRPECRGCQECRAIRVPVEAFQPNRSQTRCWRNGRGLSIEVGPPILTDEKHALYRSYLAARHDRQMSDALESLEDFLYCSPLRTQEVVYRRAGRLAAVGIFDVEPAALSTVYCYYDPADERASPGTFNVLWSIDYARRLNIPHVYLGYYIRDCSKMNYKIRFRPCELLRPDGSWERLERI